MKTIDIGTTNISIDVQIVNDTGLPVSGLDAASFPPVKYSREIGTDVTISLSNLSALTDDHTDGGLLERGEGYYRLDLPDAIATTAGVTTLRGEASGKRLIAERIQARDLATGTVQDQINNKLTTTTIQVISHQLPDGKIVLVRGDSYSDDNGRPLLWTNPDGSGWPTDLSDGSIIAIKMTAVHVEHNGTATVDVPGTHKFEATGEVIQATTPNQQIKVQLIPTNTNVAIGNYNYDVEITIDGVVSTLVTTSQANQTDAPFALNGYEKPFLEILEHYTQAA